jgi:serine/threonine-protein kinase
MIQCPSCSSRIPEESRFCSACGKEVAAASQLETVTSVPDQTPSDSDRSGRGARISTSSDPSLDARFTPGTMLAGRYRVIGLLGRGGMGEVYRADDLKLGQPVALKFLPEAVERDPHRLSRFLNEVRVALRVSHPNVCRVHDIGEVDGQHYISMEYVDGEDLASLLRRIGRFPGDRALQAARQLCAGLAAAHDQGILHRDLKPANVMIDGRGRVKITDFGLAGLAGELHGVEIRAGTPAYMAPEQLAGKEITQRSDIYALGLVLYELFTGKPAAEGSTPAEIVRRRETPPTSPSSIVEGVEPAVERVILRCLEKQPAGRPGSALAVAAALPGGDPLAAALAAGETPSPELIAEAGESGGLKPSIAVACLVAFLVTVGLLVGLSGKRVLARRVTLDTPPQVLTAKARDVIRVAGFEDPPAASLSTFFENGSYMRHLRELEPAPGRWDVLRDSQPSAVRFGYRQSPNLLARKTGSIGDWLNDPPPTLPGMVQVGLDTEGRLLSFSAVPPRTEDASEPPAGDPDWAPLLAAAGFDPQAFTPVDPVWLPPVYADRRVAWTGVYPEAPDILIRVEAASYRDRPVAFQVIEPWVRTMGKSDNDQGFWDRVADAVRMTWFFVVLVGAGVVAIRNIRLGRGDRKTAIRFALYLGAVRMLWLLGANHVPSSAELDLLTAHLAWSLYRVGLVYVFYLALEPYARRLWPHMLVSWVRLMGGRFQDPLVGRDLLVGALYGTASAMIIGVLVWIPEVLGIRGYGFETDLWSWESLRGLRHAVAAVAGVHTQSLLFVFIGIMMFLVLRLLLRKTWIAVVVVTALSMLLFNPGTGHPVPYVISVLIGMLVFWFVLFRFGLLPIVFGRTVCDLLLLLPLTFNLTAWYGYVTLLTLFVVVGVAAWGFWAALAGRPLFRDEILEAEAGAR